MDSMRAAAKRIVTTASWHRRLLAGGVAAAAMALGIEAASPAPPPRVEVTVAAHDLGGGTVIAADDVTTASFAPGSVPTGVLGDDLEGRVLAGPVRAGEPIADRRVLGPGLLDGFGADLVAAPVRIADAGAVGYVRPGDRVDILATTVDGLAPAQVLAPDVPVLSLTAAGGAAADGALILVAVAPEQAGDLAAAAVTSRLSFTLKSRRRGRSSTSV